MKYILYITILIIFSVLGCEDNGKPEISDEQRDTEKVIVTDTNRVTVYDTVKIPVKVPEKKTSYTKEFKVQQDTDYVPPRDGGVNKYWYGNRNRRLSNDSNCYFGKGKGKRHRWGRGN